MEMVILVDQDDNAIGTMEKMEAHRKGQLHRAFSVVIFNQKGEMLLQKRATQKYHSGGLWTNACCSHPQPGEKIEDAARRRLREEMGIDVAASFSHKFIYRVPLDQDLIEHEYDHVYIGIFNGEPVINRQEVEDWKFVPMNWLRNDIRLHPEKYTYWFRLMIDHPQVHSKDT
jgi:isopentenyl-diphosphate delta-isomerase